MTTVKATANQAKRTFTLRLFEDGKMYAKYRTVPMDKDEFNSCEHNTNQEMNIIK